MKTNCDQVWLNEGSIPKVPFRVNSIEIQSIVKMHVRIDYSFWSNCDQVRLNEGCTPAFPFEQTVLKVKVSLKCMSESIIHFGPIVTRYG